MNIHLGDLPVGKYRMVTDKERKRLEQMLEGSSDDTVYFESSAAAQQLWEEEQ